MKMDNQGPKISVIVPVYNVEQYLPRCIDSILAQTFTDFELLLIDDGSKDKSGAICDAYARKDPRIRVFHKPNGGVSSARNMGLDNAKGEWIAFVDSDDWVNEDYLSSFDINFDISISGYSIINEQKILDVREEAVSFKKQIITADVAQNLHKFRIQTAPWGKLYKKAIIDKYNISFPEEISYGEDSIFIYEYILHCSSALISSKVTYNYCIFQGSLGHRRYPAEHLLIMYKKQYELINLAFSDKDVLRSYLNDWAFCAVKSLREANAALLKEDTFTKYILEKHLSTIDKLSLRFDLVYKVYCKFRIHFIRKPLLKSLSK